MGNISLPLAARYLVWFVMDNHYHIVVETAEGNISQGMRQLNGVYTQAYNRRHDRVGHVYQGRFKSILVEKDEYLLELARYVVLNPMRARLVKSIPAWRWSSYRAMIEKANAPEWLETDWILGQFGKYRKSAIGNYINFVREGIGLPSIWDGLKKQILLGSDAFVQKQQKRIDKKTQLDEVPKIQRRARPKSLGFYEKKYADKYQAMAKAYSSGGYTQKEIGEYFMIHYSTVSRIIKMYES